MGFFGKWFNKVVRRAAIAGCGHETPLVFELVVNDHPHEFSWDKPGAPPLCKDCWAAISIRCAWCGNGIFPGNPVMLYTPKQDFQLPEYAVVVTENPVRVVGCLSMHCADSGADMAGHWTMERTVDTSTGIMARMGMEPGMTLVTAASSNPKKHQDDRVVVT